MFGVFALAMKSDYLFWGIFQNFYWYVTLIFEKSPSEYMFQKML